MQGAAFHYPYIHLQLQTEQHSHITVLHMARDPVWNAWCGSAGNLASALSAADTVLSTHSCWNT